MHAEQHKVLNFVFFIDYMNSNMIIVFVYFYLKFKYTGLTAIKKELYRFRFSNTPIKLSLIIHRDRLVDNNRYTNSRLIGLVIKNL